MSYQSVEWFAYTSIGSIAHSNLVGLPSFTHPSILNAIPPSAEDEIVCEFSVPVWERRYAGRSSFSSATLSQRVGVGALVELTFLEEPLVDEVVEVRVQSAVIDFVFVVVIEFGLDREASGHVQDIALKACQIVHSFSQDMCWASGNLSAGPDGVSAGDFTRRCYPAETNRAP